MFALGFFDPDGGYAHGFWSIEFVTDVFDDAIENLVDAREDAAAGNYHWFGAKLMILVKTETGSEWQELYETVGETSE